MQLEIAEGGLQEVAKAVIAQYGEFYTELERNRDKILGELDMEEQRFARTLKKGIREFERLVEEIGGKSISGPEAFRLYDTFGFPLEFTQELAQEKGFDVDVEGYHAAFAEAPEEIAGRRGAALQGRPCGQHRRNRQVAHGNASFAGRAA